MTASEKLRLITDSLSEQQKLSLIEVLTVNVNKNRTKCRCCGYLTFEGSPQENAYDICPVCFWENDGCKSDEDYSEPNHMTLGEAKQNYVKFGACDQQSAENTRSPMYFEVPEFYG